MGSGTAGSEENFFHFLTASRPTDIRRNLATQHLDPSSSVESCKFHNTSLDDDWSLCRKPTCSTHHTGSIVEEMGDPSAIEEAPISPVD